MSRSGECSSTSASARSGDPALPRTSTPVLASIDSSASDHSGCGSKTTLVLAAACRMQLSLSRDCFPLDSYTKAALHSRQAQPAQVAEPAETAELRLCERLSR